MLIFLPTKDGLGLVTSSQLSQLVSDLEFTVTERFTDMFSSWDFGEFDYIDDIKNLQDGNRTRFELKYGGEILSFDTVGAGETSTFNVNLSNSLLIVVNGVVQEPGSSYVFDGGSTFVFTEPPQPEDDIAIFFYRGSPELDTELVTTVQPSIEKGDLVQLGGLRDLRNQKDRTVSSLDSSDTIQTNLYVGPGITTEGISRSLSWTRKKYNKIVISPGPGNPNQAGNCLKIVKDVYKKIPILGVCLGHQVIGQVFGGKIVRAKNLMHGKTSKIKHNKKGLFKNIRNNFEATRYHSLIVDKKNFPKDLTITAETKNKTIMGLMHKNYDIHGFQFHPESISTKMGMKLIKNFISN